MANVSVIPAAPDHQEGSRMRSFLAERGSIIMKETRPVGRIATMYGAPLQVAAHLVVVLRGTNRDISVGVKFEQSETDTTLGSAAFVDSDEVEEFVGAFGFILNAAQGMSRERRDYTEVTYSTRDDVTIGFYQDGAKQQAFVRLGAASGLMFFSVRTLSEIEGAVREADGYVKARRAAWEASA